MAAAEVVATIGGTPPEYLPERLDVWLAECEIPAMTVIPEMTGRAVEALRRIREDSELRTLWAETDELQDWLGGVRELSERLQNNLVGFDQESLPEGADEAAGQPPARTDGGEAAMQTTESEGSDAFPAVGAAVLSFFIPGVGQMLSDQVEKGAVILGGSILTCGLCGIANILAAFDALLVGRCRERGLEVDTWEFFPSTDHGDGGRRRLPDDEADPLSAASSGRGPGGESPPPVADDQPLFGPLRETISPPDEGEDDVQVSYRPGVTSEQDYVSPPQQPFRIRDDDPDRELAWQVDALIDWFEEDPGRFESARDELGNLPPRGMRFVHQAARSPGVSYDTLDLLVTVLTDLKYPGAAPDMRLWIAHPFEQVAWAAAYGLGVYADEDLLGPGLYEMSDDERSRAMQEIARRWDAGDIDVPTLAEWADEVRERRWQRARELNENPPPPDPRLTPEQEEYLRPKTIELADSFDELAPGDQYRVDLEATKRVLDIYTEWADDEAPVVEAVEAVETYLDDGAVSKRQLAEYVERVGQVVRDAQSAADWSNQLGRYLRPDATAAHHVAQAVQYLCRPEERNRLQACHFARDGLIYSGAGFEVVEEELDWQIKRVRALR